MRRTEGTRKNKAKQRYNSDRHKTIPATEYNKTKKELKQIRIQQSNVTKDRTGRTQTEGREKETRSATNIEKRKKNNKKTVHCVHVITQGKENTAVRYERQDKTIRDERAEGGENFKTRQLNRNTDIKNK